MTFNMFIYLFHTLNKLCLISVAEMKFSTEKCVNFTKWTTGVLKLGEFNDVSDIV